MKTRQAHASIILLNYLDRGGSQGLTLKDTVETSMPILLDKDIISIGTTKQKSAPAGHFEFSLAPSRNWIAHITPGSWVLIHMAPRAITKKDIESSSIETLKMIGRVDSVRVSVSVDPTTGARQTMYRVQGRDWGQIFENSMYIDPAASFSTDSGVAQANKLGLDLLTNINLNKKENNSSTTSLIEFIIKLFAGQGLDNARKSISDSFSKGADQLLPHYVYKTPLLLKTYTDMSSDGSLTTSIKTISGKLSGYDKYKDEAESVGMPLYHMFIGNNMLWQLINEHSCNVINETIAELRWDSDKPSFCLYKRIKPFLVESAGDKTFGNVAGVGADIMSQFASAGGASAGAKVQSSFFNVKRANVDLEDIITLEMGNNWQDSSNFVELMPDPSFISMPTGQNAVAKTLPGLKAQSNEYDAKAWARDGFRPMMFNTKFFPTGSDGLIDLNGQVKWLPTIKKWYFDTHKMLNGTVTMIGQDKYIGVGDNIMFPSVAAGYTQYVAANQERPSIASEKTSNILGHIESISHTFTVQSNGARDFQTTINFCRGVIVNKKGTSILDSGSYGIDTKADKLKDDAKKHTNVTGGGS